MPHPYFATAELNGPLPLFDLTPDTIAALIAEPVMVSEDIWSWYEITAQRLIVNHYFGFHCIKDVTFSAQAP